MNKRSQIILFGSCLFALVVLLYSCERDDICAESVTPYLIINFVDFEDDTTLDDVLDLQIQYIPEEGDSLAEDFDVNLFTSATTTDSITILLPTFKNKAKFKFIQNFALDDDDDETEDLSEAEIDIVEFSYDTAEEYVNRACGFRTVYTNLEVTITPEDGNEGFIKRRQIENETIENEEEANILFSH